MISLPLPTGWSGASWMGVALAQQSTPRDGNYWDVFSGPKPSPETSTPAPAEGTQALPSPETPGLSDQKPDVPPPDTFGGTGTSSAHGGEESVGQGDEVKGSSGAAQEPLGDASPAETAQGELPQTEGPESSESATVEEQAAQPENGQEEILGEEEARAEREAMERGIEARYRVGLKAQRRGRFTAAERAYLSVLKDAPNHFRTRLQLGILYLKREPATALYHLRVAERVFPSNASVHYVLGQALEVLGYDLDAAEAYRQAIYRNPRHYNANTRLRGILRRMRSQQSMVQRAAEAFDTNPSLANLTLFGRIVMEHSSPRQAVLEFERVRKIAPELGEADLWLARALNAAGDAQGEVEAYTRYLGRHNNAVGVRLLLVQRMVERGRFRRAAELLTPLTSSTGNGSVPPSTRGRAAFLQSRLLSARQQPGEAGKRLLEAQSLRYDAMALNDAFREDLALFPEAPALWVDYARFLRERGDPAGAADALQRAGLLASDVREDTRKILQGMLAKGEAPVPVHLALGALDFAGNDTERALTHLAQVPLGHTLDPEASLLRGRIHRARGEQEAALDAFLRYILHFKERNDLIWARGNLYWELGRVDEALSVWNEEPDVLLHHPRVLLKIAARHQEQGDVAAETVTRERLARALPGNMANRIRLGELYESQGRRREALETWQAVLDERPHDPALLVRTARGWMGYNETRRGLNLLHLASELQPLEPKDSELLARALYKERRFEDALTVYWGLYKARPNHPDLPSVLPELTLNVPASIEMRRASAQLAYKAGRLPQAVEVLESLLQDLPKDKEARELLAVVYLEQNKPGQAVRVLMDSGADTGMGEESLDLLAKVQERAGRWMGLAATLEELAGFRPDDRALTRRRALVLVRLKLHKEARPLLETVLSANPEDDEVRMALARAALDEGDPSAALGHLETLLAKDPSRQEAREAMINLLTRQARWEELAPHLEVWVATHPEDIKARYNLITAYLKDFRKEDARPHYEALRKLHPARARSLDAYFR